MKIILVLVLAGALFLPVDDGVRPGSDPGLTPLGLGLTPLGPLGPLGSVNLPEKQVKVDLKQQKAFLFEKGKLVAEYLISSGKPETPTPAGKFRVILKQEMLYSKIAGCWLAFWVGFTNDGKYGFHETPICKGQREGEDKIGQPASLGCLRLKLGDAEKFYKWVDIETSIEVLEL